MIVATPRVSVVMPTYGHARFIARAIESALAQTVSDWELIIVDDASPDDTGAVVSRYVDDGRIRYSRLERNVGLGAALNRGIDAARADVIAYLPSDDVFHQGHLASLLAALADPGVVLAYSGVRHHYNRTALGRIEGEALQLVQVAHRRTADRWTERSELVTDDLDRMLWTRVASRGRVAHTGSVTCEWLEHPAQLHSTLREPIGGVNPYRARYHVREPLVFHTTVGNRLDERARYGRFRDRPDTPIASDGLRILLAGELAYNPERVLALEEEGHRLFGLWMPDPHSINTIGPLPFGHVTDLDPSRWADQAKAERVDVVYALLNWQAIPFVADVLDHMPPGVPFVWHFKEGPFIAIDRGTWPLLARICERADGLIFSSTEMREWFASAVPATRRKPALDLDGDLPKRDWLDAVASPRLSENDGEIHTVIPGRPIGLHPGDVGALAAQGIHLHFYGEVTQGFWREWIPKVRAVAPDHFHLHGNVDQDRWVEEFSRYDAGWLHVFESENGGELVRASWDDLNVPARLATLAVAGVPLLQYDNAGAAVAVDRIVREIDGGVFFKSFAELGEKLRDSAKLARLRANVWRDRERFTFDAHVPRLVTFLRSLL